MKGMAFEYSAKGKPTAFEGSILFDCLQCILRAGGDKSAGRPPLQRGKKNLIKPNKDGKNLFHVLNLPSIPARLKNNLKTVEISPVLSSGVFERATKTMS